MYLSAPCTPFDPDLFPIRNGKYEVALGLKKCDGPSDFFHIDSNLEFYRQEKQKNSLEDPSKYYFYSDEYLAIDKIVTSELLRIWSQNPAADDVDANCLDDFGKYTQEDLAVVMKNVSGKDFVAALHLSFPNHWSPSIKFKKDFDFVHAPIANIEPLIHISDKIVDMMIHKGPYKRFAWGLATDTRLNHHPTAPLNEKEEIWNGRSFDPNKPELYMRVERQIIWPFPELESSVFTIKTFFFDIREMKIKSSSSIDQLINAIESMNESALAYKGLKNDKENVLAYLAS